MSAPGPQDPTTPPGRPWARGLTRNIVLVGVTSLLTDVSGEMLVPLLPLFVATLPDVTPATLFLILGIIDAFPEGVVSLLKIASGVASDRLGKRKALTALGYGTSALAKVGLPFAAAWPHVLGVRLADLAGKGTRNPPRDALIAESTRPETVGKAFGFHRAMDTTGAIIGPVLALLLFPFFVGALGSDDAAFRELFWIAVLPAALGFLVVLLVREVAVKPRPKQKLRLSLRALPVRLRLFMIVAALYSLANFTILIWLAVVQQRSVAAGMTREGAQTFAIFYYVIFNLVYALLAIQAGSLSDRVGRRPVVLIGYTAFVAGSLGFAVTSGPYLLLPFFILYGIAYAFVEGTQRALVADLSPPDLRGTSLGTYHAATGVGTVCASLLAGTIASFVGVGVAFLAAAALASAAAALFVGTFAEAKG